MLKRIIALALCLVLAAGLVPTADAFGREPITATVTIESPSPWISAATPSGQT